MSDATTPTTPTTRGTLAELRARVKKTGPWFLVPKQAKETSCRSCDAKGLFWVVTGSGRRMIVDCIVAGGKLPDGVDDGKGVAHFATCPYAEDFRTTRSTRDARDTR
jgi:hypothetical protein